MIIDIAHDKILNMPLTIKDTNSQTIITLRPGEKKYKINGHEAEMDVAPFIDPRYGRTLVPLRFIAEATGLNVAWEPDTREVVITGRVSGKEVRLIIPMDQLKKAKIKVNGKEEYLYESRGIVYINGKRRNLEDMGLGKPVIFHGRTMVPIRFIAEIFGARIDWDPQTRTIIIKVNGS